MDGESLRRSIDQVRWPKRRDCWWKGSGNVINMRAMPNLLYYMSMEVHSRTHCLHETIFHVSLFRTICKHASLYMILPLLKNIWKLHTQFINKNKLLYFEWSPPWHVGWRLSGEGCLLVIQEAFRQRKTRNSTATKRSKQTVVHNTDKQWRVHCIFPVSLKRF